MTPSRGGGKQVGSGPDGRLLVWFFVWQQSGVVHYLLGCLPSKSLVGVIIMALVDGVEPPTPEQVDDHYQDHKE